MILDTLDHLKTYASIHPAIERAAMFLEKCIEENLPAGTYEIDGRNLYALVMDYVPQEKAAPFYETHDLYLDIQCMLCGGEYQWYIPRAKLTETAPYIPEKDITKYPFEGQGSQLDVSEGSFVLYFPQDGHLPGMMKPGVEKCKRVVVKVKC